MLEGLGRRCQEKDQGRGQGPEQKKESEAPSKKKSEATRNKKVKAEEPKKKAPSEPTKEITPAGLAELPGKASSGQTGTKRSALEAALQKEAPAAAPRKPRLPRPRSAAAPLMSQAGPAGSLASFRSSMAGGGGFLPRL